MIWGGRYAGESGTISIVTVVLVLGLVVMPTAVSAQGSEPDTAIPAQTTRSAERIVFGIPSQDLNSAILKFADRANIQVFYDADKLTGLRSSAVSGSLTVEQALTQLLAGTGFGYRFTGAKTLTLEKTATQQKAEPIQLNAVIVTGEKTTRSLRDTNTSVKVYEGEIVDNAQYQTISEAISSTLNLTVDPFGVPSIRGADGAGAASGLFSIMGGSQPRVATIIDGKAEPFFAAAAGDSGVWDVERIEVLRGPQSTIQGRNSIGGAIVVTTKDPSFHWEGALRGGYQELDGNWETAGMLSGPIIDNQLAFRVTAQRFEGDTFVDYPVPAGEQPYPFDPTAYDATNVTAKLLWTPAGMDNFFAKLTFRDRDETGPGFRNLVTGPDFDRHVVDYDQAIAARHQNTRNRSAILDLGYDFNDKLSAEVQISRTDYDWSFHEFGGEEETVAIPAPGTVPQQNMVDVTQDSKTLDARLIYTSDDDRINAFIGLYYYERDQDVLRLAQDFSVLSPFLAGTFSGALIEEFDVAGETKTEAVYMEADVALTDTVNLILGGRYERDEQTRNFMSSSFFFSSFAEKRDDSVFLPRVALNMDVSDNTTLGISANKGYTAGGYGIDFSFGVPVEPYGYESETVWTYELSARSSLFDGRVFVNANLFYNDYEDYQQASGFRVRNVDEAHTYGMELEITSLLTDKLELTVGLGLLETEVDNADSIDPALEGNELTQAPKKTALVAVNYRVNNRVSVDWRTNYVDEYFASNGIDNDSSKRVGNYVLSNLGLNFEHDDLKVRLYANNITDRDVVYNLSGSNGQVGTPRTLGISATYTF